MSQVIPARSRALLGTAALAVLLAAADTYVVVLALEDMMGGVGLGLDELQRATPIVSGFLLGYIAVLPLIGRLSDLVSRQRVLLWCLVLFGVGSVVTALAVDLPTIVGGRIIQGVGAGGLVPATLALVADVLPRGRRGAALGLVSAVQEIGSVVGPLLGAAVLAVWSWRGIFWANAGAAVVLAVAVGLLGRGAAGAGEPGAHKLFPPRTRRLTQLGALAGILGCLVVGLALWAPESLTSSVTYGPPFVPYGGHTTRMVTPVGLWGLGLLAGCLVLTFPRWWPRMRALDVIGAVLIAGALGCIVWTFANADATKEVVGPAGFWLLPVAVVCVIGYLLRHRTAADPLVGRGTVNGRVPAALAVSFLVGTALVAVVVEIPVLARLTTTNSQTVAAFVLLRFLVAAPIGAVFGGRLLRRAAPGVVAGVGLALAGAAVLLMGTWHGRVLDDLLVSTPVLLAAGFGVGLAIAPVNDVALADTREDAHGVASALVVVARMMGMVVGLAVLTAVGLHRFSQELQHAGRASEQAIRAAGVVQVHTVMTGAGICALLAAGIAFWGLGRRVEV